MNIYEEYTSRITELSKEGYGSDKIAQIISNENPNKNINAASFGRGIRRKGLHKTHEPKKESPARVLIFDLETLPYELSTRVWSLWGQNLNPSHIVKPLSIVTWAAKWLFEDKVYSMKCTSQEAINHDDKRLLEGIKAMINEADIIIAHNLDKYDEKVFQARLFANEMYRPSPYKKVDTLKIAKQMFGNKLGSNRLDYIATTVLGIDGKQSTPKGLWDDCCEGDEEAIRIMDEYCVQDVRVLEEVYLKLLPYAKNHPNMGLYVGSDVQVCPTCASNDLKWEGNYKTPMNEYESFQCNSCGSWGRSRNSSLEKSNRDRLTKGI